MFLSTGKLDAILNKTVKGLSGRIEDLKHRSERKQDLINQSNSAPSAHVQTISQRLTTLEKQGIYTKSFPKRSTKSQSLNV